jgi:hypothetical protein
LRYRWGGWGMRADPRQHPQARYLPRSPTHRAAAHRTYHPTGRRERRGGDDLSARGARAQPAGLISSESRPSGRPRRSATWRTRRKRQSRGCEMCSTTAGQSRTGSNESASLPHGRPDAQITRAAAQALALGGERREPTVQSHRLRPRQPEFCDTRFGDF